MKTKKTVSKKVAMPKKITNMAIDKKMEKMPMKKHEKMETKKFKRVEKKSKKS